MYLPYDDPPVLETEILEINHCNKISFLTSSLNNIYSQNNDKERFLIQLIKRIIFIKEYLKRYSISIDKASFKKSEKLCKLNFYILTKNL